MLDISKVWENINNKRGNVKHFKFNSVVDESNS